MRDVNGTERDLKSILKHMEQQLEVGKIEKEKLQTRLRGYETVAKLATEKQNENNVLKKQVEELQRELAVLKTSKPNEQRLSSIGSTLVHEPGVTPNEEDTHDAVSVQCLTDLQNWASPVSPRQGSSSSFTILGKSPRDTPNSYNSVSKLLSLGSSKSDNSHRGEFQVVSLTNEHDQSNAYDERESVNGKSAFEKTETSHNNVNPRSTIVLKEGEKPNLNTLDEYIQVFPQGSQSGGSNCYTPFDSGVGGGQSCTNSSRRGPMSMIDVNNGSIPTQQYLEGKEAEKKELVQRESNTPDAHDAIPFETTGSLHLDLYTGTGARPKELPGQLKKSAVGEECGDKGTNQPHSILENTTTNKMVKIPCENSNSYRINNAPMLSYGREESQTEISALTSFGSSLTSLSPEREIQDHKRLNNLNVAEQNAKSNLQASTNSVMQTSSPKVATQEEFVIIEEAPPIVPSTNPIIPTLKPVSEDIDNLEAKALLMKEVDALRKRITQLHLANKEWKDRWDGLKKQQEDENLHLKAQVKQLTQERDRMRQEMESRIVSLKEEMNNITQTKNNTEKTYMLLLSGRSQEKQLLEKLKQDYGTLHQEKRALEIQLETQQEGCQAVEKRKTNSELETELAIVKRQVTLFMDDFNNEHEERLVLESKLQKEKDAYQSLETKLRRTHALLKARDEDVRQKSKQAADLQFQIDDLKLKLEVEQRRSSIYPSMDISTQLSVQGANVGVSYVPGSTVGTGKITTTGQSHNLNVHAPKAQRWSCPACTYENKMSHKQCDICSTSREGRYVELD